MFRVVVGIVVYVASIGALQAAVADLDRWTLVQDPPHPGLTATATASAVTLSAGNVAIPSGTDIGFQGVNGQTAAVSTSGFAFDSASDVSVAIDYEWFFSGSPVGVLGLGFGIGEDRDGMNSAGVALLTSSGVPALSFGASRVADATQAPLPFSFSSLSGTLFVDYYAANGDVFVGAAPTPSASAPTTGATLIGIQNSWNDQDLLVSFFVRSDQILPGSNWQGGQADATFSNFRVFEGTVTAVPEPIAMPLIALSGLLAARRSRRPPSARWVNQHDRATPLG
ncbi:MAG: hypothetical protein AAGA03_04955 [Planctomycetota bacterium]